MFSPSLNIEHTWVCVYLEQGKIGAECIKKTSLHNRKAMNHNGQQTVPKCYPETCSQQKAALVIDGYMPKPDNKHQKAKLVPVLPS